MKEKDKQYIKELEVKLRVNEKLLERKLREKEAELQAYQQFIEIAEREMKLPEAEPSGYLI